MTDARWAPDGTRIVFVAYQGVHAQLNAASGRHWHRLLLEALAVAARLDVKTPALFLVSEADPRVPMPQSVEMYRAL